jgi:hypothetical protein
MGKKIARSRWHVRWRRTAILLICLLTRPVHAHEGPPFPLVVDHPIGSFIVSVWTDPDIGTGSFFVVIEPSGDLDLPEDLSVKIGITPVSGRLQQVMYTAEPQKVRYGARYFTEVEFDRGEFFNVEVHIESSGGSGVISAEVEATPDGALGPFSLVIYLLPFLAVGFLWMKAVLRQRRSVAE